MNKKKRKEMQKAIIEAAERKRRASLWNPTVSPKELEHFKNITFKYFECYEKISKKCSLLRSPNHTETPGRSHFGGSFLWTSGEPLPTSKNGMTLTPVVELYIDEIPFVPVQLEGIAMIQLFLELNQPKPDHYNSDPQLEYRGGDWKIKTYDSVENLFERTSEKGVDPEFLVWDKAVSYPSYPDDLGIVPHSIEEAFDRLPRSNEMAAEKISTGYWPRIGGWPRWLTGSDVGEFLIQIDGDHMGIDLGFDGQLYFGLDNEKWKMAWEIG